MPTDNAIRLMNDKIAALAKLLDTDTHAIERGFHDSLFIHGREEYLVYTDEEATAATIADIEESLWAFRSEYLGKWLDLNPSQVNALRKMQESLCEDANPLIRKMIGDGFAAFAAKAIKDDGRGAFLAGYDHEEREIKHAGQFFYVYRVN